MPLSDRLTLAMSSAGISQADLARACKVKPPSVHGWLSGKAKFLRGENLLLAAAALGVNQQWLATGEGPMLPDDRSMSFAVSGETFGFARSGKTVSSLATNVAQGPDIRGKVPLISWVQAGDWCHAADPHLPGQADRWMDCPASHSSSTFALRVRGDSMTAPHGNSRTYPEGCFIFVDPEKRTPDNGDRVVACLTGTDEVTFKIYKNEDGRQWLQPLNPSHEPIRESFHIIGTVLGKWEDG